MNEILNIMFKCFDFAIFEDLKPFSYQILSFYNKKCW